jgi:hypothetical protein
MTDSPVTSLPLKPNTTSFARRRHRTGELNVTGNKQRACAQQRSGDDESDTRQCVVRISGLGVVATSHGILGGLGWPGQDTATEGMRDDDSRKRRGM